MHTSLIVLTDDIFAAIYGEDFEQAESRTAWKVRYFRDFAGNFLPVTFPPSRL